MTAVAADSKILNQPVTFESNLNRPIRIEFRSFAGHYNHIVNFSYLMLEFDGADIFL